MLLTEEEIQFNLCSGDLLDDAFMKVAKAQLKKVLEEAGKRIFREELSSRFLIPLSRDEWQALLEEVK